MSSATHESLLEQLDRMDVLNGETLALDAAFKAYSRRDPQDSSRGLSDSEACSRKQGGNVTLRYGVHGAVDTGSEMPLAVVVKPANAYEKKTSSKLLPKPSGRKRRRKHVVADTQYSSQTFREEVQYVGTEPAIPYPETSERRKSSLRP